MCPSPGRAPDGHRIGYALDVDRAVLQQRDERPDGGEHGRHHTHDASRKRKFRDRAAACRTCTRRTFPVQLLHLSKAAPLSALKDSQKLFRHQRAPDAYTQSGGIGLGKARLDPSVIPRARGRRGLGRESVRHLTPGVAGQLHQRRALAGTSRRGDPPAVEPDEMPDDREAEAEPSCVRVKPDSWRKRSNAAGTSRPAPVSSLTRRPSNPFLTVT